MSRDVADLVAKAIAAGQIGQPVFARCLIGLPDDRHDQVNLLADAILTIASWFGAPVERVYGAGTWGRGISLHLQLRNGASCLICDTDAPSRAADLIVLGNHGAIYHDVLSGGTAQFCGAFPESASKRAIRTVIEAAVETGRVQPVGDSGG